MATRSSGSGVFVTLGVLAVLLLAAFIVSIVFYGQKQRAEEELQSMQQNVQRFLGADQEQDPAQRWLAEAPSNESVLRYLWESYADAMEQVVGDSDAMPSELVEELEDVEGAETTPLLGLLEQRNRQIASLNDQLSDAEAAAAAARADLDAEIERLEQIQTDHASTISALNDELSQYKGELDRYRSLVDETIDENNSRVERIRQDAASQEASLQQRIAALEDEALLLQDQLRALRSEKADDTLMPEDEYALVDGRVVGGDATEGLVYIDRGRQDRVVLGMTFEVYDNASAIRPDDDGNYPTGKATVEVVQINPASSVCRTLLQSRGNPVVEGDVLANAVYDPEKQYAFVVFGNFDTDGDGLATEPEQNAIRAIIADWGGLVDDEMTGRTDFLVLGERPILPPRPPVDAPGAVINEYIRKRQQVDRYDELFRTASQTGIPVLNQNRLDTLTGLAGRR